MVTRILKQQRPSRNILIPNSALKNRSPTRLPKISPRKNGASARRAGRRIDRGIGEKYPAFRQLVQVGCLCDVIDSSRSFDLRIDTSLPTPVIGKCKENIGPIFSKARSPGKEKKKKNSNHRIPSNLHAEWSREPLPIR